MKTGQWIGLGAIVGAIILAGMGRAEDWPQWRGPKRDGVSAEKNLLKAWAVTGPKLLWQVKDIGRGFGSMTVAGGRIYTTGNKGLDNEFVSALNAKDGKPIWSTRLGKVGNPEQQPNYPGARSTPTLDGEFVYALGSDGDLACVEAKSGKLVWRKSLRTDFGGKPGVWAYSESPLVEGNKVIVTPGGEKAAMVALDKKTGGAIWKATLPDGGDAAYASAVVLGNGGARQIVQFFSKGLMGVDAATGRFLWKFDKTNDTMYGMHAATPVISGENIYTAAATGGGVARLAKGEAGRTTATAAYVQRKTPNALGGSIKVGDYLYGTTNSVLLCTEFATGKIVWEDRSVGAGSICFADGRLYLHGENGQVALVEATPAGYHELGRFKPSDAPDRGDSKAWAHPAVANGVLYIRELGTLWAYDIRATPGQ